MSKYAEWWFANKGTELAGGRGEGEHLGCLRHAALRGKMSQTQKGVEKQRGAVVATHPS